MHAAHHDRSHPLDSPARRYGSRRDFFGTLIGAGWGAMSLLEGSIARAGLARAQSAGSATNLFDIEQVADGVYAALARPAAMINSNAAIFVNSEDVLVMDTHSKPSAAAALIAQIRKEVTPKPVRYVVNSHFHWDHMQGNAAYRATFPKVDFVSSVATRTLMALEAPSRLKKSLADLPGEVEKTRAALGRAASEREKEFYRRMLDEQEAYRKEMALFRLELPTLTLDHGMVLHDQAHTLELAFWGRAHTAGDVVIFCPEKKVVATGDMIHGFLPFIADGYPREWPKTIDVVARYAFAAIIPGHGPVHRDRVRIRHMREYIEELSAKVADGKKAGRSVAELQKTITRASLRSLQTDNYETLVRDALRKFTMVPGEPNLEEGIMSNVKDVFDTLDKK